MTAVRHTSPADTGAAGDAGDHRSPAAWRVALAIALVEGVRLLRHPATVTGLLMSSGIAALVLGTIAPVVRRETAELAAVALPTAGGVLLASHLAASRLDRDAVQPLADATPATPATRTTGLLLALFAPAAATAVWTLAVVVLMPLTGGADVPAVTGTPAAGDVLAPSATVLVFGAFGVALGRWLPGLLVGPFTLPVLAVALLVVYDGFAGFAAERLLPVADWVAPGELIELRPRAPWLHLAYVLLVAATLAGVALLRDHARAVVAVLTAASVMGVAAAAGRLVSVWHDPRPVTALVRDIRDPGDRLRCDRHPQVPVCVPLGYEPWRGRLRAPAVAALAQVPASARLAPIEVHLRAEPWQLMTSTSATPPGAADRLPPDVGAALPRDVREALVPWPYSPEPPRLARGGAPGTVPARFLRYRGARGDAQRLDLALGVLAEVTGVRNTIRRRERQLRVWWGLVPTAPPDSVTPGAAADCPPDLEAREVLTFALAAMSDPAFRAALDAELAAHPSIWADGGGLDDWFALPGGGVTGYAATDHTSGDDTGPWSRSAATLGLALADRTDADDLHAQWDRWTDPGTGAEELLGEYGIPPLRPAPCP